MDVQVHTHTIYNTVHTATEHRITNIIENTVIKMFWTLLNMIYVTETSSKQHKDFINHQLTIVIHFYIALELGLEHQLQ